jgi:hypothetical protein
MIENGFDDTEAGAVANSVATDSTEVNAEVYNELPAPFNQQWANLHAKLESLIVDAIEAGADEVQLRSILVSDVDQLLANHSKVSPTTTYRVPALATEGVCENCGLKVMFCMDDSNNALWATMGAQGPASGDGSDGDFLCKPSNGNPLTMHKVEGWL